VVKKKILFIDHVPFAGGAQLRLASDIAHLDRTQFEPYLVISKESSDQIFKDADVPIFRIDFGQLKIVSPQVVKRLLSSVRQFNNIVVEVKPDIVIANTSRALVITLLAKKRFQLVSYIRDYDYPKWLMKLARLRVNRFLFVSRSIKEFYGLKGEVVYLGSEILEKTKSIKAKADNKITVGYVGRLVDWKGADVLVEAFAQSKLPDVQLVIFGTGKGQEGDIEEDLRSRIQDLRIGERVKIMGFVDNLVAYQMIDIFVLPSKKPEPFATNVIEAALMQKPIIATNIGGTPEFIKDGKSGLLVAPGNINSLHSTLEKLISDQKLQKRLLEQAYDDAQDFTEEQFMKRFQKLLNL
jgi:glycosyltransferase involved in cell wall biosynthesis